MPGLRSEQQQVWQDGCGKPVLRGLVAIGRAPLSWRAAPVRQNQGRRYPGGAWAVLTDRAMAHFSREPDELGVVVRGATLAV
jgi:hypothetical protein